MGHWGFEPLQNDLAVDWLVSLEDFIKKSIQNKEGSIEEKIAAIYTLTLLELKPNFTKSGTCPLGYKFPNFRIVNLSLKCLEKIKAKIIETNHPATEQINQLKDKLEVIKNKLLAECL